MRENSRNPYADTRLLPREVSVNFAQELAVDPHATLLAEVHTYRLSCPCFGVELPVPPQPTSIVAPWNGGRRQLLSLESGPFFSLEHADRACTRRTLGWGTDGDRWAGLLFPPDKWEEITKVPTRPKAEGVNRYLNDIWTPSLLFAAAGFVLIPTDELTWTRVIIPTGFVGKSYWEGPRPPLLSSYVSPLFEAYDVPNLLVRSPGTRNGLSPRGLRYCEAEDWYEGFFPSRAEGKAVALHVLRGLTEDALTAGTAHLRRAECFEGLATSLLSDEVPTPLSVNDT